MVTETPFQKKFEEICQQNMQIFEDVELGSLTVKEAALKSNYLFEKFINSMRYPHEIKAVIPQSIDKSYYNGE